MRHLDEMVPQNMDIPNAGLCERCVHCKRTSSARGSVFRLCLLYERDPRFPKYPKLPVLSCPGFLRKAENESS
jgi:hypothetical protein